ncbi:hypothetical protein TNCV_2431001 [Trichonephila clavipes]|nr:hypothetical protein TNCV_2431001 [Trichonephila clavipes]
MDTTMESTSWTETPLQLTSRHQPGGLAALAVDESECVVVMDTYWFRYPLVAQWETRVMAALVECKVMDVYVAGFVNVSETNGPRRDECVFGSRTK